MQPLENRPNSLTIKEVFSPQYDLETIEEKLPVTENLGAQQNREETLSSQEINSEASREEIVELMRAIAS